VKAERGAARVPVVIFKPLELVGAHVIELEAHADERGFFARCFCEREFAERGLPTRFPQCNLSRNTRVGTLRGMHFQVGHEGEAKIVRAVTGAIHDVIADIRPSSPTYRQWYGVELSSENAKALFVPAGFAHGFITLEDDTDVYYHMSDFFRPEGARGFRWNDPSFGIRWPGVPAVISERDASYPDFGPASVAD
jgi:dTDP-4-dehydrorhamnose 3,5-epimerase